MSILNVAQLSVRWFVVHTRGFDSFFLGMSRLLTGPLESYISPSYAFMEMQNELLPHTSPGITNQAINMLGESSACSKGSNRLLGNSPLHLCDFDIHDCTGKQKRDAIDMSEGPFIGVPLLRDAWC